MPTLNTVLQKLVPVISTTLFYALYYLISSLHFDVQIKPAAVPFDFLLQLLVAYLLFALSRRLWVFVVLQGLLMGLIYVGNAVKISFFGGPTIMDYTQAPDGMRVRPLPGLHIDLLADGGLEVCKEPPFSSACQASTRWLQDVQIVNDDLFIGQQFTRQPHRGREITGVSTAGAQP